MIRGTNNDNYPIILYILMQKVVIQSLVKISNEGGGERSKNSTVPIGAEASNTL